MLSLRKVSFGFGGTPLLEEASFEVAPGDRLGLLGRNGEGKSTLFKLITGEYQPDGGEVDRVGQPRIEVLSQEIPGFVGPVKGYLLDRLADPSLPDWELEGAVERIAGELGLSLDQPFENLSVGMKRQVAFRTCLSRMPDLLLLDEPTNHLDIQAIWGMEETLAGFRGGLLFITHDRWFLRKLASEILDLDRGRLTRWNCDYETYLRRKQDWLDGEEKRMEAFDKKLAKEEAWIRQGIKARRTRNEGRVRALESLRRQRRLRRSKPGGVKMAWDAADRSGTKVMEAIDVTLSFEQKKVVKGFSTLIQRGDRIGIVGPNGSGKTTLIRLLLKELKPTSGEVVHGTRLEVAYFDQTRETLDPEASVRESVADGNETVEVAGRKRHVVGYLQDFLFQPERIRGPVKSLSGGEVNRLLLARLFTKPFNVLVLDEPTNDLDMETLELLEDQLGEFNGTLLMVSHDRDFLDRVLTELYVLDGGGKVESFIGGYADWEKENPGGFFGVRKDRQAGPASGGGNRRKKKPERFLNRERWELEALPGEIEKLEAEQGMLTESMADPSLYSGEMTELQKIKARLAEIELEISAKYARWEILEERRQRLEERSQ